MLKLSHYISIKNVRAPPSLNSCGTKSLVKLGSRRPNFKNTLEERPSEKSCSTSFFQSVNDKVKKVSTLFFHVNLLLVATHLRNISGLASKSLMGFKIVFEFSKSWFKNTLEERTFFDDVLPFSKGIPS